MFGFKVRQAIKDLMYSIEVEIRNLPTDRVTLNLVECTFWVHRDGYAGRKCYGFDVGSDCINFAYGPSIDSREHEEIKLSPREVLYCKSIFRRIRKEYKKRKKEAQARILSDTKSKQIDDLFAKIELERVSDNRSEYDCSLLFR